ncbi:MAG: PhnD/SsuA/transferrin family substrate-binding protein [Candidatus Delongbacteria bacterium]|nr:PhnD/SsuA/transferrin family substrate-binding protein [Candidatus Delongbacteria bacterium]
MKKILMLLIIVVMTAQMFAQEATKRVPNPDELTLAILPTYSRLEIMGMYAQIKGEIKKATGKKVKLKVAKDFRQHLKWMNEGTVDLAFSNPVVCAQALENVDLLVTAVVDDEPIFKGAVIVLEGSPLKEAEDCKGKKLGVVSWKSGGGYLSQYIAFMGEGIDILSDCKTKKIKAGKVNNLIKELKKGTFDAICIPCTDLAKADRIIGKGKYTKIMDGEYLPNWAVSARKDLDTSIKRKITAAFLSLKEGSKALKKIQIDSFTPSDDSEYEPILYILEGKGVE